MKDTKPKEIKKILKNQKKEHQKLKSHKEAEALVLSQLKQTGKVYLQQGNLKQKMFFNIQKIIPQTARNSSIKLDKPVIESNDPSKILINFDKPFSKTVSNNDFSQLVTPRQKVERPEPFTEQVSLISEEAFE